MTSPFSTGRRGVQYGGAISRAKAVKGAEDLLALSKRLKAAGQKDLRNELHKAMRDAAKPLIPKVRAAARAKLPKAGGLNERIAKKPYRSQVRTGATTAGVRITGTKVDPRINEGRVWHPVFGDRKPGAIQRVPSADGYFDDTLRESAPEVQDELRRTFSAFVDRLVREL
jgi:hypothetical protein